MILREIEEWLLQTTSNDKKMNEGKILTSHFGCTDIGVFFVILHPYCMITGNHVV